jgi:tetratricopeptide (TPR) repeat protein
VPDKFKQVAKLVWVFLAACLLAAGPLKPGAPAWTLTEATRLLYRGEYGEVAAKTREYVKVHPHDSAARILLARALLAQGNYLGAYSELSRVVQSEPRNIDGLYYLGMTSSLLSQLEYQELVREAPDHFRVHQLLAESYQAQENKAKAEQEYLAALKSNPHSSEVLDDLGDLKRDEFQFDEAAKYYDRALRISPRDYEAKYGLGACALFTHDVPQAIEFLKEAVDLDPASAAARLALGDALLRDSKTPEAINELRVAVKLQPDMRQAYSLLARAYGKLGQAALSQEALDKERELAHDEQARLQRTLDTEKGVILVAPELWQAPPSSPSPEIRP